MRRPTCLLLACLALALLPTGCGGPSRTPFQPAGVRIIRDYTFASRDGVPLRLDLYLPETYAKPLPIVIWLHGGGWMFGSKERCPLASLAARGYAVASVGYGLSDRSERTAFPAPLYDCKAAVRWLRANAWRFGCDGGRIGVWGLSAGAHLAALLGTTAGEADLEGGEGPIGPSSAVQGVVAMFAPTDLLALEQADEKNWRVTLVAQGLLHGRPSEHPDLARAASPALHVTRDSAPFLLIHGRDDIMVPVAQSGLMHAALQAAGVPSTLLLFDHLPHGDSALDNPEVQAAAIAFLAARLQPEGVGEAVGVPAKP